MDEPIHALVYIVVPISLILSFGALIPFQRYTGLGRDKAYFTLFASVVIGDIHSYLNLPRLEALMRSDLRPTLAPLEVVCRLVAAALIGPLLIAFILRLWGRWIGGRSTPEERLPDAAVFRLGSAVPISQSPCCSFSARGSARMFPPS